MRNSISWGIFGQLVIFCYFLICSGCNEIGLFKKPSDSVKTQISLQDKKLPLGTYSAKNFKCNGNPPLGNFFSNYENQKWKINDTTLTIIYSFPGCEIGMNNIVDENSEGVLKLYPIDSISCSNPQVCEKYLKDLNGAVCGSKNDFTIGTYLFSSKAGSSNVYVITIGEKRKACSLGSAGEDPLSWEINLQ